MKILQKKSKRKLLKLRYLFGITFVLFVFLYFGNDLLIKFENQSLSIILKKNNKERIQNAKKTPLEGNNFSTYSRWLSTISRTHAHNHLRTALLESYKSLEKITPNAPWVYAEAGWKMAGILAL